MSLHCKLDPVHYREYKYGIRKRGKYLPLGGSGVAVVGVTDGM